MLLSMWSLLSYILFEQFYSHVSFNTAFQWGLIFNGYTEFQNSKLQEASQLCRELKPPQLERAANMADKAGDLFLENGTPDTAAIAMERAAKYNTFFNEVFFITN